MMRGTLTDALNLKQHIDTALHPAYNLVVAKGGIKFGLYKDGETNKLANGRTLTGRDSEWLADGTAVYQGVRMGDLTESLQTRVGRQVIDKTGLKDFYDITLFLPLEHYDASRADAADSPIPMIFDGLKKIGLELQATKAGDGCRFTIDQHRTDRRWTRVEVVCGGRAGLMWMVDIYETVSY